MADQQGLSNKDKVCQFFASNAGLHFRSADVAAALGLDGRSVGQQLARLWRAGFVEKVQTTPYATWRMKLHTYPGRNLHGPAAPKPAIQTPAKKSTRGSRSHEEVRNDSGHCPMGSPMIQGWREGDSEEGEEEVDQEGSLVDAPSVRIPASHSVSSKPPSSTRREATSSQENISGQKKAAESPTTKRKLGHPPGNKLSAKTTVQVGLKGSKTGKTTLRFGQKTSCVATGLKRKVSSDSKNADQGQKGRVKSTTSQSALREDSSDRRYTDSESSSPNIVQKRKVGAETRKGNQGLKPKGKKRKSQPALREDSSERSSTDSESSSPKVARTVLNRKVGAEKTKGNQGMKGIVKKTMSQTMDKDCSNRSGVGSESLSQVQNKTRLMPTAVSCQRISTTAVKKNTDKGQKRKVTKKTMTPTTDREGEVGSSGTGSLQNKARIMPVTLAPSLNKPAGNMETKLLNFIQEAQGMLVMTGNDVAKALGSKPKETHRLLLHMQRTGQVRKVCDKPTRWMMLGGGQGRGGLARKGQTQGLHSTKHQPMSNQTSRNLHSGTVTSTLTSRNLHSGTASSTQTSRNLHTGTASSTQTSRNLHTGTASSTQTSRNLHSGTATSTQTSRNLHSGTASSTQTSRNLHSGTASSTQTSRNLHSGTASSTQTSRNLHSGTATSTQTSRNLHIVTATEEANSRTRHSVRAQSGGGLVEKRQTFLTLPSAEEEEGDTETAFTSAQWSTEPERCLNTEEEEEEEDISCDSHEQESVILEDVDFCTKKNRSTSSSQQSLSKNENLSGNQRSQGTSALRRSCGMFVRKTPVKKPVLLDNQEPARMSVKDVFSSNLTATIVKPSEGSPKQTSNQNEVLGSCQANKGLSNFKIPKKIQHTSKDLVEKTQTSVCQKSEDLHPGKGMSLSASPSQTEVNKLYSKKDNTHKDKQGSKTQRAAGTSKIPPHILKHSVSYFASATTEPNTTPKPRRAFKITRNDRTEQDRPEKPFVRATDGDVLEEPLIDIDVAVDLSLNKTQLKSGAHFCSSMCDNDRGLLHSPLSSSIRKPPSRPPKLYPHTARESAREKRMVGTFGSCNSPPVLFKQEENIRRDRTESPAFRAARRNLYPWLASETSTQHQQSSISSSSMPEQSLYNEDENRCFSSGLVEHDASLTAGSSHGSQADADMEIERQSTCCLAWNSNELEKDRETAARLGGQEYVSGKRSFLTGSDCCKQSTCSLSLVEDVRTDPRRARGQGVYAELLDNSRVTRSEDIGQARQGSGTLLHVGSQSKDRAGQGTRSGSSLSSQDRLREGNVFGHCCSTAASSKMTLAHGRGDFPSAEQIVYNTTTKSKMVSAHGRGAVPGAEQLVCSTTTNSKMASTHCTGPVPGAKQFNSHPRSCSTTIAALHTHHDEKEAARAKSEHGRRYVQMESRVTPADVQCKNKSKNEDSNSTLIAENMHLCHDRNVSAGMRQYRKRDNAGRLLAQAIKSAVSPLNVPGGRKTTCNIRDVKRTEDRSESLGHTALQCGASQHVKSGSVLQPAREITCLTLSNETHQKHTANKGQGNCQSAEAGKAVSSVSIRRMVSYVPTRQLRTTTVDNKVPVHHLGAVPSAEPLVGHPNGYPRTDPALNVCSVGNVEQAGHRPNSERLPKPANIHQVTENRNSARLEVPTPHDAATGSVCRHKEMSSRCKTDLAHEKKRAKASWPLPTEDCCSGQEDVSPVKSRRISLGTEVTVPHTRVTNTARNNDENLYKSDNVSILREQKLSAMNSKSHNHTTTTHRARSNAGNVYKCDNVCFLGEQASQATISESHSESLPKVGDVLFTSSKRVSTASLTQERHNLNKQDASQNVEERSFEKCPQNESARWQRPRSPKSFLTDYWSKADSKDTKDFVAESKTVNSRLLAYPTTSVEINDSEEESPSDLSKNKSKICVNEVLFKDNANLDEKSQIVLKEEPKTFCTTETQTSQEFVHTSQAATSESSDLRYSLKNLITKVQSDEDDVVVSLEERAGGQAVSSPIGPLEQSTWTQPKALYTSNETEPVEEGERVADEETGGQEKPPVDEVKGHDGSEVSQVIIHQSSVARVTPQGGRQVATSDQPSGTPQLQGHPIVQLNELCQRNRLRICFQDISVTGPAHRPRVQLAAVVGERAFQAEASSKKAARRQAARKALQALYQEGYK